VVATLAYPVYVKGEPLLPPVVVDIVKTYLLLAAVILYVKGLIALGIARGLAVYVYFPEEDRPIYSQIYAYIRHPIYSASIHIALWIGCEANNLVAFACSLFTIACLLLWVRLEELELVERFGDSYRRYRAEVPAFFPKRQQVGPFLRCLALDW
jgi:protein-S-isoprenylcysteine O-methyltransferase Ste14